METKPPTIKGLFVKTHIARVKKVAGSEGMLDLEKLYGKPLKFGNLQDVPVIEEIKVIDSAMEVLYQNLVHKKNWDIEAGKFHFENFVATPLAKFLLTKFGKKFKAMMLVSDKIAQRVFKVLSFQGRDLGGNKIKLTMKNSDYPLEHFVGFFQAWLSYIGFIGMVRAREVSPGYHEYVITWKEKSK